MAEKWLKTCLVRRSEGNENGYLSLREMAHESICTILSILNDKSFVFIITLLSRFCFTCYNIRIPSTNVTNFFQPIFKNR